MTKTKRIGVLTSGGDSQGMNACLKTIITMAERNGYEVVAFLGGYGGLLYDKYRIVTTKEADLYFSFGGSFISSGRCPEFMEAKNKIIAKKVYDKHKLEALIVLGGDGSIKGANDLVEYGFNVVVCPCTIDNDVYCTDCCIGFDTAVNNAVNAIDNIKQTMKTNGRILIAETMGRKCGEIAIHAGICSEADIIMIPENKQTIEKIVREVGKQLKVGNTSPVVVVTEHQVDINYLAKQMEEAHKNECKAIVVGYVQRGGSPTVQDKLLAVRMGVAAMNSVLERNFGNVISLIKDEIKLIPFEKAIKAKYVFDTELWNTFLNLKRYKTEKKK